MLKGPFELIILVTAGIPGEEAKQVITMLSTGKELLHIRPGDLDEASFLDYLKAIPSSFYSRIVIHGHYKLAPDLGLRGIHLTEKARNAGIWKKITGGDYKGTISASFHRLAELTADPFPYSYVFLSPVFPSLSKPGYKGVLETDELPGFLKTKSSVIPVFALGGITEQTISTAQKMGFDGAVAYGTIWQSNNPAATLETIRSGILPA
jgi:hydroxymethylpyrimidine kinase/phosphomethylpyrimidine kinase/thiamine-phosphate diphosphorylase